MKMKIWDMEVDEKIIWSVIGGYIAGWALKGIGIIVVAIILVIIWKKKKKK